MIINIASFGGRTHMLDLARELEKQGNIVRFYSYVPTKRAVTFGLKKNNSYSLFYLSIPFLILFKIFGFKKKLLYIYRIIYDYITAWIMKPCDVFIGQVPMHLYTYRRAKNKYNAITICESGLSNIDEYIRLLKKIEATNSLQIGVNRYRKCYHTADYISVASEFSFNGFIKQGFKKEKLFLNPYGVSIIDFYPTILEQKPYDCIFVGQWCKRKGVDMIEKVCKELHLSLLHIGSITDMPFPNNKLFTHIDSINENLLVKYYSKAKIFLLPSYEDGYGLVLNQAAICGLPIICSPNTGGPTLRNMLPNKKWIIIMSEINSDSLKQCIKKGLDLASQQKGIRSYITNNNIISWESYGKRYHEFLLSIIDYHDNDN